MKKIMVMVMVVVMLSGLMSGCRGWWHKDGHHDNRRYHDSK